MRGEGKLESEGEESEETSITTKGRVEIRGSMCRMRKRKL